MNLFEQLMPVVNVLIPVFLIMGLGALSVKTKIFTKADTTVFTRYDYYFALPALMFLTLATSDFTSINNIPFLLTTFLGLLLTLLAIIVVGKILRFPNKFIGIAAVAGTFGNITYMGVPVMKSLYGDTSLPYVAVISGITIAFCMVISILVLELMDDEKKSNAKTLFLNTIKNPLVIAIVLGVLASFVKIHLPPYIEGMLKMVKDSASAVALFSIGMFMVGQKITGQMSKIIFICTANMIVLPLIVFALGKSFGLTGDLFNISLLEAAMPLGTTTFVIAQKYKNHDDTIATAVILSTLFSIVTLGLLIFFLH